MKKYINYVALVVLCAIGAAVWYYYNQNESVTFTVTNTTDFSRDGELIEIPFDKLGVDKSGSFVLVDSAANEIAYQLTDNSLLFQASVAARSSSRYHLRKGNAATPIYKVFARFVPERKDDFAWENDIAAYRMYGPALANENPSNGVDLWLKKTDELIVDTFYYREHELGLPYHVDYGKGLDCYKVAHTVGCGGVALLLNDSLYVGNHYDNWEILEEGPLRTIFCLTYDSFPVGDTYLRETLRVTVCAGSVVNKAEVLFEGADINDLQVAAGIYLHNGEGVIKNDVTNRWIAYAEDAVSDAGVPVGQNYVGVIMPQSQGAKVLSNSLIVYQPTSVDGITYYFGGGWSQWHFPTDHSWFEAIEQASIVIDNPLVVNVLKD